MSTRRAGRRADPPWRDGEAGAVAAEFAITLPALLIVIALGAAALAAGAQTVRLQDAAADAARLAAREEPDAAVHAAASASGSKPSISVARRGDLVCVTLAEPVRIAALPAAGLTASASSCALSGGR